MSVETVLSQNDDHSKATAGQDGLENVPVPPSAGMLLAGLLAWPDKVSINDLRRITNSFELVDMARNGRKIAQCWAADSYGFEVTAHSNNGEDTVLECKLTLEWEGKDAWNYWGGYGHNNRFDAINQTREQSGLEKLGNYAEVLAAIEIDFQLWDDTEAFLWTRDVELAEKYFSQAMAMTIQDRELWGRVLPDDLAAAMSAQLLKHRPARDGGRKRRLT